VVRDGIEGFIVPIRDSRAIVECLTRVAGDQEELQRLSQAARTRAGEFTWERYSQRLLEALTGSGHKPMHVP
jgi:glycosyltransferase involved in cell wall biosynthesis